MDKTKDETISASTKADKNKDNKRAPKMERIGKYANTSVKVEKLSKEHDHDGSEHTSYPRKSSHASLTESAILEKTEDRVSSAILIVMLVIFLGYLFILKFTPRFGDKVASNGSASNGMGFSLTRYDCKKHNGDFSGCVKAQTSGMGCAWYSDCSKCINDNAEPKDWAKICAQ